MTAKTKPVDTRQRLLEAAEHRIRSDGYHAMSFRDLADDLGIKSSSVHYYFRRKEDLAVALVEQYSDGFFSLLEEKTTDATTSAERVAAICQLYRSAFTPLGHICLCGILGAEKNGLPVEVSDAVANFLGANIDWTAAALAADLSKPARQARAEHIIATLQGALILTKNLSGIDVFDRIVTDLTEI